MIDAQQRAAAKAFAKNWKDRGYEKGDSQIFWVELLTTVFGVTEVLEAFSTFQYKKGIEEVSTDRSILAILPEKEYQSYFENLMYRLILNNGSHILLILLYKMN